MLSEKIYLHKRAGGGIYYLIIATRINGRRKLKKISCKTRLKNEALAFLKSYEKEKEKAVINPHIKLSDIRIPVFDYVRSNLSSGSYQKYEITLRYLIGYLGDRELNSITLGDIERFKSFLIRRIKKETANIYIRYVKAIWNLLVRLGFLSFSTLSDIKQFKTHEKEIISFTNEEVVRILIEIKEDKYRKIVMMALETGLRISELLNLKVSNIDPQNEIIRLNNSAEFYTKSRKDRLIPFNKQIKDILTELMSDKTESGQYLFVRRNNIPLRRDCVTRYFRKTLDKLGFDKRYHFHCLRATFIMRLARKGVNPIFIQRLVGHSTLAVTQKYCFVHISDLRNAINS